MAVTTAVTRVACNTGTGTQDITVGGFGTPKAALFICSKATANGVAADHYVLSFGAATGTSNEWCLSLNTEDGVATTDTRATTDSDRCIRLNNPGTATVDGEAEFTAFITDGVRINWLNAPSAAWLLTVVLFGGSDLSAHANNIALGNSLDNAVDVTAPGFEPTLVFTACQGSLGMDADASSLRDAFGIVHNDGGVTQRSAAYENPNGAAAGNPTGRCTESYGIMQIAGGGSAALDWGGEFGSFDGSGFTVTTRNAGANNTSMMYLALRLGGIQNGWVGTVDTPTSTGNETETGPSFTPQIVYQIGTHMEAIDTAYNSSPLAGVTGLGAFTDSAEYMTSVADEDGASTTDTQSLSDDTAIELPEDDGTAGLTASFVGMVSTGYTLNYSAVLGNAKKFFNLAIEGEPPNPDAITRLRRSQVIGPW